MGFEQYKTKAAATGGTRQPGTANLGGAAVKVIEKNVIDGRMVITASLLVDCLGLLAGKELKFVSAPDYAAKNEDNLKRGYGSGKDSILVLENCIKLDSEEDTFQARWITTAISSVKSGNEDTGHHLREVNKVFIGMPTMYFKNPVVGANEPLHISFGITENTVRLRGPKGYDNYDRKWILEKLAQVKEPKKAVRASAMTLMPEFSAKASSLDEAYELIKGLIENQNSMAYVRVRDESDNVEVVTVRYDYQKTPDVVIEDLKAANLFRNLPNDAVAAEVAAGNWSLEVMQAIDVPFLGDTLERMVADVLNAPDPATMINANINYGNERYDVTEAILVTLPLKDGTPMFVHNPIRVNTQTTPRYQMRYLPTPHFNVPQPARDAAANAASNAASADAAAGTEAAPGGESFDGNDYDFTPADAQGNAVEGADAGFSDDAPQQSASRSRFGPANR